MNYTEQKKQTISDGEFEEIKENVRQYKENMDQRKAELGEEEDPDVPQAGQIYHHDENSLFLDDIINVEEKRKVE